MTKYTKKRPSVPGSREAEGAKNLRVPKIYICSYNVRSLKGQDRLEELESELSATRFRWSVIGLSETRRKGEHLVQLNSGHVLYTKGGEKSVGGVGFLVNKNIKDRVVEYRGDSSRVASLTIKINAKYHLQIVQVYAPTSTHEDEEVEEFYAEVSKIMSENKSYYKIVLGDFNAKVGSHQQGDGAAVGQYGYGERNERGTRLVQFATSERLTISNTCFKKRQSRKWTWKSPNGLVKNEIDYLLTNKKSLVENVEVIQRVNVGSDHRLIRGTIKPNPRLERSRMIRSGKPKINIGGLLLKKEEFQLRLQNRFEVLQQRRRR